MTKICILIGRLNGGGAERSAGLLSYILSNLGYQVSIIILQDDINYAFKGHLINLGKLKGRSVLDKTLKYLELKKTLKQNQFNLILDFRVKMFSFREFVLNTFVFKAANMINMVRSYNLKWYLPGSKFFSKYMYGKYAGINTVSYKIQEQIKSRYKFSNVNTIYSPIDINHIKKKAEIKIESTFEEEFIIAVGRLDVNKQFGELIQAYGKSVLLKKKIKLYILGSGYEKEKLLTIIGRLNLGNFVKLLPFQENPFIYMKQAKFLVLSSKKEGFPRVLIESLACATPVISFDCNSGPSEIIDNEKNGLLVEDQNFIKLTVAMDRMVLDSNLYSVCKDNALKSVDRFSMEVISKEWKEYIKELV